MRHSDRNRSYDRNSHFYRFAADIPANSYVNHGLGHLYIVRGLADGVTARLRFYYRRDRDRFVQQNRAKGARTA